MENQSTPQTVPRPVSPSKWLARGHYSNDIETKKLHILVYGSPKVGKTTLFGTFPNPIAIDADNGLVTLRGRKIFGFVPGKGEQTFNDVMAFLTDIKMKRNGFGPGEEFADVQTVGIDTITTLSERIKEDTMIHPKSGKVLDPNNDKPEFDHWGYTKSRLGTIIDVLHELPMHTYVSAWSTIIEDEKTGTKLGIPKTEGSYKEVMAGRFDEVYYAYTQAGTPTKYFIRTQPYAYYIAGSRLGLPAVIENPTFEALQKALREGASR